MNNVSKVNKGNVLTHVQQKRYLTNVINHLTSEMAKSVL